MVAPAARGDADVELLADRYRLGATLGRGASAEVRRATDVRLGRDVAVKIIWPAADADGGAARRVDREARRSASLSHPNVVQVHDVGTAEGRPYIVMELVEGPTLKEALAGSEPLPVDRALEIAVGMCDGLGAAHAQGIVHRDVKPGNVLLADGVRPKLSDFGIARALGVHTTTEEAVGGTAAYIAPEQLFEGEVDERADVYAVGAVLFEMLTGRAPFLGGTVAETAFMRLHVDPPRVTDHADVPASLDAVVDRALARDPADRYASATALRDDLEAVLRRPDDETQPMPPPPDPQRTGATRRSPNLLAIGLLVVIAVVAGWLLLRGADDVATVTVPDLVGRDLSAATDLLARGDLTVGAVTRRPATEPPGTVLAQNPASDAVVTPGSAVNLVVSASAETPSPTPTAEGDTGPAEPDGRPADGRGPGGEGPPGQDGGPPGRGRPGG